MYTPRHRLMNIQWRYFFPSSLVSFVVACFVENFWKEEKIKQFVSMAFRNALCALTFSCPLLSYSCNREWLFSFWNVAHWLCASLHECIECKWCLWTKQNLNVFMSRFLFWQIYNEKWCLKSAFTGKSGRPQADIRVTSRKSTDHG